MSGRHTHRRARVAGRLLLAACLAACVTVGLAMNADAAKRKPARRASLRAGKPVPPPPAPMTEPAAAVDSSRWAWTEARRLVDQDRHAEALVVVQRGLRRDPASTDLRWLEAAIQHFMGNNTESVELYLRLIADHPEMAREVRGDLAAARLDAGDASGALRDLDLRVTENPADRDAREHRAKALSLVGRLPESLAAYDALLAENPGDDDLLMERARVLAWLGRNGEAAGVYQQVLARDPGNRSARLGLGVNQNWRGRHRVAAARLESLTAEPDADPEAMKALAFARYWNGEPDRARAAVDQYLVREPDDREALDLRKKLDDERSRAVWAGYAHSTDSDQLDVNTTFAGLRHPLPAQSMLELAWREDHATDPGGERRPAQIGGSIETIWSPLFTTHADVRHARLGGGLGDETLGGLSVTWRPEDRVRLDFGAERNLVMTRLALERRIAVRSWNAGADWKMTERLRVRGSGTRRGYSDGNHTHTLSGALAWKAWSHHDLTLTPRISAERLESDENPGNGYYAPEQYTEWGPGLQAEWNPRKYVSLSGDAMVGGQHERGGRSQSFVNASGRFAWIMRDLFTIAIEGGRSNSDLSTADGYERRFWAASLTRGF